MNESIITGLTGYSNKRLYNNIPRAFTPIEPYERGGKQYKEDKNALMKVYGNLSPVSLQDTIFGADHYQSFDINYSMHDYVFGSQLNEWQALQQTLNARDSQARHLISYDFETIGVRNAKAFDVNTSALTEFGFTDTIVKNGKQGKSVSYSVAFGINQQQGASFIEDMDTLFNVGTSKLSKSEAGAVTSTVERLTRYAGDITELFDSVNVGRFKNVTIVNKLSPSSVSSQTRALEGLMNLSVLGGMNSSKFETMIKGTSFYSKDIVADFIARKELFDASGFKHQNSQSRILNSLKQKIADASQKSGYHVLGYNINAFDNPIFNAIGDKNIKLNSQNVLDVYSAFSVLGNGSEIGVAEQIAMQHGWDSVNFSKKVKEEGLARALGLSFGDVAHNAASDTAIVNEIIMSNDFLNNMPLFNNITPKAKNGINIFGENTVGLALSSIHYDKNGQDLMLVSNKKGGFEVANQYYTSGVNRNRYYHIDGILDNNGNGVLVQMTSAGSGEKQMFFKHYDTIEDANEAIRKQFIFEDKTKFGSTPEAIQKYIDKHDIAYRGDTARREYERLFGTDSISTYYDRNTQTSSLQGGYDRLNQYYQAYKESAIKMKNHYGLQAGEALTEEQLREIASSDIFDKDIEKALIKAGAGYGDNGTSIAPSTLRNVKNLIGKFQDESEMFETLNANFTDSSMNLYQKTMVAKSFRDKIINSAEQSSEVLATDIPGGFGLTKRFDYARRQDLFSVNLRGNINKGDAVIDATINFENERHATSHLYNTVMSHARSAKKGDVNDSAMRLMEDMVRHLHTDGYVSDDFFSSFTRSYAQNQSANYQPWRYAEWIVSEIRTGYVQPLQNIGFDLSSLHTFGSGQTEDIFGLGGQHFSGLNSSNISKSMLSTIKNTHKNLLDEGYSLDDVIRYHYADLTLGKMSEYSGLYEKKAFGTKFGDKAESLNTVYKQAFDETMANSFIQDKINETGNIIYRLSSTGESKPGTATVDDIKMKTMKLMGYDEATAKEVGRMFSFQKNDNEAFGLLTYGSKQNGDKADFITTFFHTGVEGDNGFILLNKSDDVSGYNRMLNKLTTATHENYASVMSEIMEDGSAAVLKLPSIHDHGNIFKNADGSPLLGGYIGLDGKATPYSFKTMDYGNKGFQKVVRKSINAYQKDGSQGLSSLVMEVTDDAFEVNKWYTHTRKSLVAALQDESMSYGERYKKASDVVRKYQNRVMKDEIMPGLSGASTVLRVKGDFEKVALPNMADIMQSQKINITPLKNLFIQSIADGLQGGTPLGDKDLRMARFVAQFINNPKANSAEALIYQLSKDVAGNYNYNFGAEFEEAFAKHLFALNIQNAEGYNTSVGMPSGTIIDYLYEVSQLKDKNGKGKYHESTTRLVEMLYKNNKAGNISQILKEKDIENGYVSLIDPMMFVPHSHMDSEMRPVSVQQLTADSYITADVEKELGKDFIKKMDIRLGYDSPSYQLEVLRKSLKENYGEIAPGITYGDLSQGISAKFKNISSAEGMFLLNKAEKNLSDIAADNLKNLTVAKDIAKFKISADVNEKLTKASLDLLRDNAAFNVDESKGFLHPVFANNSYFTSPSLRSFDLNGTISPNQAKELAELIQTKKPEIYDGFNFSKFFLDEKGYALKVLDDIGGEVELKYHGTRGTIVGTNKKDLEMLIDTFTSGKGYLQERKQGMMDAKVILGNEKFTARVLEWEGHLNIDESGVWRNFRQILSDAKITNAADQWEIIKKYSGGMFETVFGENVVGVVNLPLDKHINATASNYMNYILNFANSSLTGNDKYDKTIKNRFDKLFNDARLQVKADYGYGQKDKRFSSGLMLKFVGEGKDKRITYDSSMLQEEGALLQIEAVVDSIMKDSRPYFDPLRKQFKESEKEQLIRGTLVKGINQEAKGKEIYMDARMAISLRGKGTENYSGKMIPFSGKKGFDFNSIINDEGETLLINDYVYDRMKKEALTGIDEVKFKEAEKTVRGMYGVLDAYKTGGSYAESNILELKLEDIVLAPEGYSEGIEDYMRYGTFKMVEEYRDGAGELKYRTKYSKELQKIADKQKVNLADVKMLKINLGDGLTYDINGPDGKSRQMSSIFMPLMDVSPYGEDVYLTSTQRNMMKTLNTARNTKGQGLNEVRSQLGRNVEDMIVGFQNELTSKKESYLSKRLMRFKMQNSGMLFAEHTKVPVVNAAVSKRSQWLKDESFRENIIKAVAEGKAHGNVSWNDIGMAENKFNAAPFSRKINGVMRYDDIVEMGREGFEAKDVNFRKSGLDILTNTKNYSEMSALAVHGSGNPTDLKTLLNLDNKRARLAEEAKKFGIKDADEALAILNGSKKHFRGKDAKNKFNAFKNATSGILEEVTEDYLTKVGTFGLVGRYPTFHEGSINYVISRLNKNLSRDELTVTPMLAKRLNMDHDGDNGIIKLFMENGLLLNNISNDKKGNPLFKAISKEYNDYLVSGKNNKIFADMLADISQQIKENGGKEVDIISAIRPNERVYSRAKTLQKTLTKQNKLDFINELKQSNFTFGSIALETAEDIDNLLKPNGDNMHFVKARGRYEFTGDAQALINKLFVYQQRIGGNFLKSEFMKASSIKARATKFEIGYISNPNYYINQTMNDMFTRYVDGTQNGTISQQQINKLLEIKNILHRDNVGFLPITEQASIDVKHIVAGLSISETPKYSSGIKSIFNITGDKLKDEKAQRYGLTQVYEALKFNSKAINRDVYKTTGGFANEILSHDLQYFIDAGDTTGQMGRALIDLANLTTASERKNLTGKMATLATDISGVYSFLDDVNSALADYKANNIVAKRTTSGLLLSELGAEVSAFKRQWRSDNGILQELNSESVYFERVTEGDSKFFRPKAVTFEGFDVDDNGIYTLKFKDFSKKRNNAIEIKGTDSQVHAQLKQRFGAFDSVSKGEATLLLSANRKGNIVASANYRGRVAEANAMQYLQLRAEHELAGKNYSSEQYLKGALKNYQNGSKPLGFEETEALLKKIDNAFTGKGKAYLELRNNLRYIKSSRPSVQLTETMPFDDTLQQLNRQIVDSARNKKTTTSVNEIFKDFYTRVSGDSNIMNEFSGPIYKQFIKDQKNSVANFSGFFGQFDDKRIDMRTANKQFRDTVGADANEVVEKAIQSKLDSYSMQNQTVEYQARQLMQQFETKKDVNDMFDWNSKKAGDFRVGFDDGTGQWIGRKFSSLSEDDINSILSYTTQDISGLDEYRVSQTKGRLADFAANAKKYKTSPLRGANAQDLSDIGGMLQGLNQETIKKAEEAGERALEREALQEGTQEALESLVMKPKVLGEAWDKVKDFAGKHKKGIGAGALAIGALGLVNGLMNSNDSPLAPNELKAKPKAGSVGRGKGAPKTPNNVYANPTDGLNYRMSASSVKRINNAQAAQQFGSVAGGSTNVNVRDERKPVSDSWLQEKFSDYV